MKIKAFLVSLTILFPLIACAAEPAPLEHAAQLVLKRGQEAIVTPIIATYFKIPPNSLNEKTGLPEAVGRQVAVSSADYESTWWVHAFKDPRSAKISILIMECVKGIQLSIKGIQCKEELTIWSTSQNGVLEKAGLVIWPFKNSSSAINILPLTEQSELDKFPGIVKAIQAWEKAQSEKEMVKQGGDSNG